MFQPNQLLPTPQAGSAPPTIQLTITPQGAGQSPSSQGGQQPKKKGALANAMGNPSSAAGSVLAKKSHPQTQPQPQVQQPVAQPNNVAAQVQQLNQLAAPQQSGYPNLSLPYSNAPAPVQMQPRASIPAIAASLPPQKGPNDINGPGWNKDFNANNAQIQAQILSNQQAADQYRKAEMAIASQPLPTEPQYNAPQMQQQNKYQQLATALAGILSPRALPSIEAGMKLGDTERQNKYQQDVEAAKARYEAQKDVYGAKLTAREKEEQVNELGAARAESAANSAIANEERALNIKQAGDEFAANQRTKMAQLDIALENAKTHRMALSEQTSKDMDLFNLRNDGLQQAWQLKMDGFQNTLTKAGMSRESALNVARYRNIAEMIIHAQNSGAIKNNPAYVAAKGWLSAKQQEINALQRGSASPAQMNAWANDLQNSLQNGTGAAMLSQLDQLPDFDRSQLLDSLAGLGSEAQNLGYTDIANPVTDPANITINNILPQREQDYLNSQSGAKSQASQPPAQPQTNVPSDDLNVIDGYMNNPAQKAAIVKYHAKGGQDLTDFETNVLHVPAGTIDQYFDQKKK